MVGIRDLDCSYMRVRVRVRFRVEVGVRFRGRVRYVRFFVRIRVLC